MRWDTDNAHTARPPRRLSRLVARVLGLLADIGIGLALMHDGSAWPLLLHPLAVSLWAHGMWGLGAGDLRDAGFRIMPRRAPARDVEGASEAAAITDEPPQRGKALIFSLVALLLFPGFGPLGWSIASALGTLPSRARRVAVTSDLGDMPTTFVPPDADDPWVAVAVQPMVDVLREPDPTLRRAAIRILGAEPSRDAVRMLSELLVDPDPDVRSEASATLFRFENQLNRTLGAALARVREEPDRADRYAELAACYERYTACDLLDPASAHLYSARARDALEGAVALAPQRPDLWLALARARRDSGEMAAAMTALDRLAALSPDDPQAVLLRMEIAYRAQQWDALTTISHAERRRVADTPAMRELLHWWMDVTDNVALPLAGALPQPAHEG